MKSNHVPVVERLQNRIRRLQHQADSNHVKSPSKGNPYYCCKVCGVHDSELSIRDGRHFEGCWVGGISKQIAHYKKLLDAHLDAA